MNTNPNIPKCIKCGLKTGHFSGICLKCRNSLKTPIRKFKRRTKKEMKC